LSHPTQIAVFVTHFPLTSSLTSFTIRDHNRPQRTEAAVLFSWCEMFMSFSTRILLGLALLLAAAGTLYPRSAAGDDVNHYELGTATMRANGQTIYPAGVSDPSRVNPPGPSAEGAVPIPPAPELSIGATPIGPPVGTTSIGPSLGTLPPSAPVWSPSGPASPNNIAPPTANPGAWNTPVAVQTPVYPSATAMLAAEKPSPASWYARVEYYHWNERIGGEDFVNEDGALTTLGYSRQIGIERFRAELFGGTVQYASYGEASNTGYLGLRGEYEIVLAPAAWEGRAAFLAGLGTRFWVRDLHDDPGNGVAGYQETWWTIYPYLGLETHMNLGADLQLYSESRIGATVMTYQFASVTNLIYDPTNPFNPSNPPFIAQRPLWPKPGIVANTEIGLRGPRFFVAARFEVMSWSPSSDEVSLAQDVNQPNSIMFTAGGRFGFMF
jgi:hypothetical protein